MGLFDFFKKTAKDIFRTTELVSPVSKTTLKDKKAQSLVSTTRKVIGGSLALAGGTAGLGTSLGRKAVLGSLKFIAPKTTKGAIKTVAVGTIGTSALISSPELRKVTKKTIKDTPKTLVGAGKFIGETVEKLPKDKQEKVGKIATKTGLFGVGAGLLAGASAFGVPLAKEKLKSVPSMFKSKPQETPTILTPTTSTSEKGVFSPSPLTPSTVEVSPTKKRKRRATKKKIEGIKVSQNVRIINQI